MTRGLAPRGASACLIAGACSVVGGCWNPWAPVLSCTGLNAGDHVTIRLVTAKGRNGNPACDLPVLGITPGQALEVVVSEVAECGAAVGPVESNDSAVWSWDERGSKVMTQEAGSYWGYTGSVESSTGCEFDVSMALRSIVELPVPREGEGAVLELRLTPFSNSPCGEFCAGEFEVWVQPGTRADLGLGGAGGAGP